MSDKLSGLEDVANSTFDYIVVGGGTAGCVVANRLSEDLNVTVAVLEAGPPHLNDPLIDNPSVFLKPLFDPEYDYLYSTAPQPGVDGRSIMFPRGRGLGGTSQINWMIWNIPQKEEVEAGGRVHTVHCRKEVIVCAGTVKSPHILELSGIGDRKILEPLGIDVKVDLPGVGTNVQEHVSMGTNRWKIKEDKNIVTSGMLEDPVQAEKLRIALGLPNAIQPVVNSVIFLPLQVGSDRADELIRKQKEKFARTASTLPPGLKAQYELQMQMLEDPNVPDYEIILLPFMARFFPNPEPDKPYLNMVPTLGRPFSRGTIHAGSANPKANPIIDPHYYEEEIDLDIIVDGIKFIRKIVQTEPFSTIIEREELPGPEVQTDEQIYEYVRKNSGSSWHTCGSNSMLPRDKGGVVDSKFKIYGTQNIRVVDLSVLPLHTAVHPQATVYTLAEMACDIIRG